MNFKQSVRGLFKHKVHIHGIKTHVRVTPLDAFQDSTFHTLLSCLTQEERKESVKMSGKDLWSCTSLVHLWEQYPELKGAEFICSNMQA